ncbi:MAG: calcium-binding protein [Anaerolineaceae bacterium]|nr:calcium-binding protein [Anaerolineaceae bacterium]
MTDEKEPPTVMIAWDSLTLKMLPESFIKESEREGLDWKRMGVSADQVELSQPRDTLAAVKRTAKEISAQYEWAHLGEEGERIQKVLDGANKKGEMAAFKTWAKYLNKILTFPFEAEVTEWQERGPLQTGDRVTILSFEDIEDMYGILANIKAKRGKYYVFPLCDLKAIYPKSPNYQPLDDYAVWFANR